MSKRGGIGAMRHRVTVQSKTVTRDAVGGRVNTWAAVSVALTDIACRIEPVRPFERSAYAHTVGGVSHVITIRDPGVDIDRRHRLTSGSRVFEIRGVTNPDGRDRFLRIVVDETLTGGGGTDGEAM